MARIVRDRILKDTNGNIEDHLRSHIHLTNCIHLKNHMHKQSPVLSDRSLLRDLVALQRSRSLRDPSMSPPSWQSPSVVDVLLRRGERENGNRRRSIGIDHEVAQVSEQRSSISKNGARERRRVKRAVSHGSDREFLAGDNFSGNSEPKGRLKTSVNLQTLSERLQAVPLESDEAASSHNHVDVRGPRGGLNRGRRRKFQRARRNEVSVESNSFVQGGGLRNEAGPTNGCGIPWNWSRIHHRGKSFLDSAGRSLSCGLSESRLRKNGTNLPDMPVISDYSTSSTKSRAEALPLLIDASGSQRSMDNRANASWVHDYSGELGVFADDLLNHEEYDSEFVPEQQNRRTHRHQSITQKYTPRTFKDLVGQHLVAQALSNAIIRRKIGFLYVFYGPHGTGKTSTARIFSRALICQSQDHPKPCGVCNHCISYDMKKTRNIREIGSVTNFDFQGIMDLLEHMILSQYRVVIFDDCDTLSSDSWSAITKVIDRAPRRVVFLLVCSSLDVLPHIIISRCQKFFFPKLKDADIIYALQWIATNEDLEIDKDALKLIASKSDGSLRDAEMTLEQLSLLGQRISVSLVQEMVGLISDEKLVDLLDYALSADTVNTVKNLREIMESGVEPLALMSQLATVITDILAGGYIFTKNGYRRKFFKRQTLSKEDMEKLRQALKTLSEAEKQLRMSNDRLTWLTAALLQLAPDQQYLLPINSSTETSFNHTPLRLNKTNPRKSNDSRNDAYYNAKMSANKLPVKYHGEIEEIWLNVLEQIKMNSVKEFLYSEGKLISVSYGEATTVRLVFTSHVNKLTAERFKTHILQAFEAVLGDPLTIEISSERREEKRSEIVEVEASPSIRERNDEYNERKASEYNRSLSLVKSKVSLGHVIQQAEQSGWSNEKGVSIAEKLEQENLRLEPKSRSLLCWNASKVSRRKVSRWKVRTKKPQRLLRFVSCGRCLSSKSPR